MEYCLNSIQTSSALGDHENRSHCNIVTPLIAVSSKQSKLVQFAFRKMFSNLLILSTESQPQLILVSWLTDGAVFVLSSRLRWSAPCCRARGRPSSIRWRRKRTSSLSCSTSWTSWRAPSRGRKTRYAEQRANLVINLRF